MKKPFLFACSGAILFCSCAHPKENQKELLSDILKSHEQVMTDDEKVQACKMELDTLLKQKPALKDQIVFISSELSAADSSMEDWMHKFKPDNISKPADEAVNYLTEQKKQLSKVDAQLYNAADKAGKFISQHK